MQALSRLFSNLLKCPLVQRSAAQEAVNKPDGEAEKVPAAQSPLSFTCWKSCCLCCHGEDQPSFPLILIKCCSIKAPLVQNPQTAGENLSF